MRKSIVLLFLVGLMLAACAAPAAPAETPAPTFDIAMAQYVLDTAGFHDMAETLAATQTVEAGYLGTVTRVRKVLAAAPWPEALAEDGQAFLKDLDALAAALEADNGPEAAKLAEQVHDAQHAFSHEIDHWLGAEGGHDH